MNYNELKVINNARLWSYETIKKIKDCVAHIDDDLLNKKENPSQCYDFKSNERKGSTTVNTMLNYWQVYFWHLIYWTALHLLSYIVLLANTLRGLTTMFELRELITGILQFTIFFPLEQCLPEQDLMGDGKNMDSPDS